MDLLWSDFINSQWSDWRGTGESGDRLDEPLWVARFLSDWNLSAPCPPVPVDLAAIKEFRAQLRRLAEQAGSGAALPAADIQALNVAMRQAPVTRVAEPTEGGRYRVSLVPVAGGWQQVLGEIAASFADTLAQGEPARLRVCGNPDCRWVFYDDTRSRTKRFCDEKLCGNLMKVRRFRAKQKTSADRADPGGGGV